MMTADNGRLTNKNLTSRMLVKILREVDWCGSGRVGKPVTSADAQVLCSSSPVDANTPFGFCFVLKLAFSVLKRLVRPMRQLKLATDKLMSVVCWSLDRISVGRCLYFDRIGRTSAYCDRVACLTAKFVISISAYSCMIS